MSKEKVEYREALVTYLDVLGFGDLVRKSETGPPKADYIHSILELLRKEAERGNMARVRPRRAPEFFVDNFSDTIIRTKFIKPAIALSAVKSEIWQLGYLQLMLSAYDPILLRGGIARGKLYRERRGKFIFGPALVRAHELAEQMAIYPRILIDRDLVQMLETSGELWHEYYRCGDDGAYFVDYLNAAYREKWQFNPRETVGDSLAFHKIQAENKLEELSKKSDHLRQKALWLGLYHNSTVERFISQSPELEEEFSPLLIAKEMLLG